MQRQVIISLLLICRLFSSGSGSGFFRPDTIPPPPPGLPATLAGPDFSCVADTSIYTVDTPVGYTCQWGLDGIVQPDSSSALGIVWSQPGGHIISVAFICNGGQTSDPQGMITEVGKAPEVFLGNDTTLQQGQSLLLDAGNPGCTYLWSTGATTQTILVTVSGTYSVQVTNACGTDSDDIAVTILVGIPSPAKDDELAIMIQNNRLILNKIPEETERVAVFNLTGRTIFDGKPRREIELPSPGIYFLKIISYKNTSSRKFIIR